MILVASIGHLYSNQCAFHVTTAVWFEYGKECLLFTARHGEPTSQRYHQDWALEGNLRLEFRKKAICIEHKCNQLHFAICQMEKIVWHPLCGSCSWKRILAMQLVDVECFNTQQAFRVLNDADISDIIKCLCVCSTENNHVTGGGTMQSRKHPDHLHLESLPD